MNKVLSLFLALVMLLSLAACGQKTEPEPADDPQPEQQEQQEPAVEPEKEADPEPAPAADADDRGIDGMQAYMVMGMMQSDPFCFSTGVEEEAPAEAKEVFDSMVVNDSTGSDGMMYNYVLTLDSDDEIISASFGVVGDNAGKVKTAADLFFYAVAIVPYDGNDEDTLKAWMEDAIDQCVNGEVSTTIGGVAFTMNQASGLSYWVDISKAA